MFNLLILENTPIFRQLQIEEALLRADERNWCIINKGVAPAVVMGISGRVEELVDSNAAASFGVPIIRRFSGGGTVVVDEHTFFITWIANSEQISVPCCPKKIMEWTAGLYQPVFAGVDFHLRENDYAIGEKKCGGNAQYLRKGRWLHHTTFLWDYRQEHMELLKMPKKMPIYRQGRPHAEFLCKLADYFATPADFSYQLLHHLSQILPLQAVEAAEAEAKLACNHRKATAFVV